jgi:hypothetical protein
VADQAAIDAIKAQLPDSPETFGVTDAFITAMLDAGTTRTKTILAGWRAVAAKASTTEDITENSSSRTIRLSDRAEERIRDWQARADVEDKLAITDPLGRQRFASHRATRV